MKCPKCKSDSIWYDGIYKHWHCAKCIEFFEHPIPDSANFKCPKCGSGNINASDTYQFVYDCQQCGNYWHQRQQEEIERLKEGLKKLEWSYNFCPVCDGHNPKIVSPLSLREPDRNGHKPDCWLSKLIGGER